MCGFAGFLGLDGLSNDDAVAVATRMGDAIRHRGPDDSGVWHDPVAEITLIHRRLSILELSPAGRQPMLSASGRFAIAFNGEIYNHLALRRELDSQPSSCAAGWRGRSDTETLLAAIEVWGLAATLCRAVGMFAIALWDRQERKLVLARDRSGEKPLYYGWQGGVFLFASELKALKRHPAFRAEIDRDAVTQFLRFGYVPAPYSIHRGVHKLPAAHVLTLHWPRSQGQEECAPYWSCATEFAAGRSQPFPGSPSEAADTLDLLLRDAIADQMVADVPIGAFLSGGIDSSTIVALMQQQATRPVKTFTIGFDVAGYDEAGHAMAVARQLGTEHNELYVTAREAMAVVPLLPAIYDEPFADPAEIPNFLLSRLTREQVTVALTGDAGDELFGGYNRYFIIDAWWKKTRRLPPWKRRAIAMSLQSIPSASWPFIERQVNARTSATSPWRHICKDPRRIARLLTATCPASFYFESSSHWCEPESIVIGGTDVPMPGSHPPLPLASACEQMMLSDFANYLPDDILVKVDRAAMAVSLETRAPFLDHRVIEFAWRIPLSMKMSRGEGKKVLKDLAYRYVPRELLERPKMGFGVPIDVWLRGPLRDWAESLLDETRLKQEGYFRTAPIRQRWSQHLDGRNNWADPLWDVLMFQAWLEAESCRD